METRFISLFYMSPNNYVCATITPHNTVGVWIFSPPKETRFCFCFVFCCTNKCDEWKWISLSSIFTRRCTYWCVRARRLSRLVYPAAARVSLYLSSPMDCSHTHTDHSGTHTSGTTDTHTSDANPDSSMVAVGLWKKKKKHTGDGERRQVGGETGVWNHN